MTNWKDIATAPKDGTKILFVDKYKQVGICWWSNKHLTEGWNSDSCESFGGFEEPLIWDHLPDLPEGFGYLTDLEVV